jgi:hypothetical protein
MVDSSGWIMALSEGSGEVLPGTTQLDLWGEEWRIDRISSLPGGNSTGKILVSRPWPGERPDWARDDREQMEFYPTVFGLVITPAPASVDPDAAVADVFEQLAQEMGENAGEQVVMDMSLEGLQAMMNEHGIGLEQAVAFAVITHLTGHFQVVLQTAVSVAREWGRREGAAGAE